MRKIVLICVGNLKEKYLVDAVNEYTKRISKYFDFKIVEISETKINGKPTLKAIENALKDEGVKILGKITNGTTASFCVEGTEISSPEFAQFIEKETNNKTLYLVIGASYGLCDEIKKLGKKISFGKVTYPHQLMRVIALEQIYRAGTILNGVEYHK